MQFSIVSFLALVASATAANSILFHNQDQTARTVYFTGNPTSQALPALKVPGVSNVTLSIPQGWVGNFFSVTDGAAYKPGMLGEVNFNSWGGLTYFDVSAIVDPSDWQGVQWIFPANAQAPSSGCDDFLCDNIYQLWNDVQTKATHETDLVVILGRPLGWLKRDEAPFARAHPRAFKEAVFPRSFIESRPQ